MSYPQRYFFNLQYLKPTEFNALFKQRILTLAQEGGYFSKTNIGKWTDFYDPASLDSLLGMEGNDVRKMEKIPGTTNLKVNVDNGLLNLSETQNLLETQAFNTPIPFTLEQFVLVISP